MLMVLNVHPNLLNHEDHRCEKKYGETINSIFENWFNPEEHVALIEEDFDFIKHYKLGTYVYEWDKTKETDEVAKRLEEAENFYLSAVKAIHDKNIAPITSLNISITKPFPTMDRAFI
jgi:hypothetical protein